MITGVARPILLLEQLKSDKSQGVWGTASPRTHFLKVPMRREFSVEQFNVIMVSRSLARVANVPLTP